MGQRATERNTEEVVWMQNSVIMPESCNRQDFLLTEEAALRESVLPTGGKGWRPPARHTEVDSCTGEDSFGLTSHSEADSGVTYLLSIDCVIRKLAAQGPV